jgi:hypothetical protein
VGADRVIIYDPSWNPAEDRQAVDRAYRIGQTRDVVIYRMIMASTVEEKMYGRQVLKDGLRVVTESGTASKYFSTGDMKELFTLGPHGTEHITYRGLVFIFLFKVVVKSWKNYGTSQKKKYMSWMI